MEELLTNLMIFEIVTELIGATIGAGLCFGALKWRRGLLTTTAIGWGAVIGLVLGVWYLDVFYAEPVVILICAALGALIFHILTYTIPGVNRFVLGYLIGFKLTLMLVTVLLKEGSIALEAAISMPIVVGCILGLFLMMWIQMRVSAFILGCTFIGAADIAPVISEWYNRIMYGFTSDISYLFDPIDLLFNLFKIELTDMITFISMIVLMVLGCVCQLGKLKEQNIPFSTPLIGFEVPKEDNGKIYR